MKSLLLSSVAVFAAFLFFNALAFAQSNEPPSGQFGLGLFTGSAVGGISGTYAVSRNMQVGTAFTLGITSVGGGSATTFGLAPFFRYLFDAPISPYVQGGFSIASTPELNTTFSLAFGGGLAYYFNRTFGVEMSLDVLDIAFTNPSAVTFGWEYTSAGVVWFFGS